MRRVLLLQMPFGSINRPSIALSLLKSSLKTANIGCDIRYVNLDFANQIGESLYNSISEVLPQSYLFGELVFSPLVFTDHFINQISVEELSDLMPKRCGPYGTVPPSILGRLSSLTDSAQLFLQQVLQDIPWEQYFLVGFGAMFQQTLASVALAHLIKELPTSPQIILGGSNCEGVMGLAIHESFPSVDYVCRGEGEELIVQLAQRLLQNSFDLQNIKGLIWRRDQTSICNGGATTPIQHLDLLPKPKYDDWISQLSETTLDLPNKMLPLETSRGCWYGAKFHCTFCGLNGESMAYRSKTPRRVINELEELIGYEISSINVVDNILDFRYFKTLLPDLINLDHPFTIFYEVKSNLTREQMKLLRQAGIRWIQPGIESLDTSVLSIMKKGVSGIQNVRLLKYAAEFEMGVAWNILYGFPGESPEAYARMSNLIPAITHLQPPIMNGTQVRLDRFSPLFREKESLGITNVRPFPTYKLAYPLPQEVISNLAYYFEFDYVTPQVPERYTRQLQNALKTWHEEAGRAAFVSVQKNEELHLFDSRPIASIHVARLSGLERDVLLACSEGASLESLVKGLGYSELAIGNTLDRFLESNWIVALDNQYLNVSVPMDDAIPARIPPEILGPVCLSLYRSRMTVPISKIKDDCAYIEA